jgi:hypothetical protein
LTEKDPLNFSDGRMVEENPVQGVTLAIAMTIVLFTWVCFPIGRWRP